MFRSISGYTGRTRTVESAGSLLVCEGGTGNNKKPKPGVRKNRRNSKKPRKK